MRLGGNPPTASLINLTTAPAQRMPPQTGSYQSHRHHSIATQPVVGSFGRPLIHSPFYIPQRSHRFALAHRRPSHPRSRPLSTSPVAQKIGLLWVIFRGAIKRCFTIHHLGKNPSPTTQSTSSQCPHHCSSKHLIAPRFVFANPKTHCFRCPFAASVT